MVSCDTLYVPIYSSIDLDASVVDINMRVDYDSTQLRLLDVTSPLLSNSCTSATGGVRFTPSRTITPSSYGGQNLMLKNFCGIDSLSPFAVLSFVTLTNNRVNSRLTIDSINFDTEDVILYRLIATGDRATIIAQKSEITIQNEPQFDSVRILECVDRTLTVLNTGDVANSVDMLLDLPATVSIVGSVPPMGNLVPPGDSAVITLRFCPRAEFAVDSAITGVSSSPCEVRDTSVVRGFGYAPEFDVALAPTRTFFLPDSIVATIGDTIEIPIMIEKDISATYGGVTYFLNGLNFDVSLAYAPRSLKFIDVSYLAEPTTTTVTSVLGDIQFSVRGADTIRSGPFARIRYVMMVPEFAQTDVTVSSQGFTSDSLQFLDVIPAGGRAPVVTGERCNITVVRYATVGRPMMNVTPQPVRDQLAGLRRLDVAPRLQGQAPAALGERGAGCRGVSGEQRVGGIGIRSRAQRAGHVGLSGGRAAAAGREAHVLRRGQVDRAGAGAHGAAGGESLQLDAFAGVDPAGDILPIAHSRASYYRSMQMSSQLAREVSQLPLISQSIISSQTHVHVWNSQHQQ
jgi:hypothetical protein